MTIWLMPAPECFSAYYFRCESESGLVDIIDALRPLRLDGTLRSSSHIANDYKVISALQQYPWEETGGETPLLPSKMKEFRRELKIGVWNGSGALYGTRAQVKEAKRLLRRALAGKAQRLQFLDDRLLGLAKRFAKPFELVSGWKMERTLAVLEPVYGLMKGVPTLHPMASTYWRKRNPPPPDPDPDRDGCGLLWCSPVVPNDGEHASLLTTAASEIMLARGFEPMISITVLSERALACIISIGYDRKVPGEDARARECHRELMRRSAELGYHSYRLGVSSMAGNMGQTGAYLDLLQTIKQSLDPSGILAPGRYIPEAQAQEPTEVKPQTDVLVYKMYR
jgi:4-cresol dehydrogenase (hydroxylating)